MQLIFAEACERLFELHDGGYRKPPSQHRATATRTRSRRRATVPPLRAIAPI